MVHQHVYTFIFLFTIRRAYSPDYDLRDPPVLWDTSPGTCGQKATWKFLTEIEDILKYYYCCGSGRDSIVRINAEA